MFSMARRGVLTITTHRKRVGITRRIPMTRLSFIGITSLCLTTALAQTGRFGVVSGQEVVQDVPTRTTDHDISLVGINKFRKACSETNEMDCTTSAYVLAALEIDEYLTVVGLEIGQLNCETLQDAEDADRLRFEISTSETVVAKKKSFKKFDGERFRSNKPRMVWMGEIIDTEGIYQDIPRLISMTWSDCDMEAFLLSVTIPTFDGNTHNIKSMPCRTSSGTTEVCLVETSRRGEDETEYNLLQPNDISDDDGDEHGHRRLTGDPNGSIKNAVRGQEILPSSAQPSKAEVHRRLSREVSDGIEAARIADPEIDAKDADISLLREYLDATPPEKKKLHDRGVRRLSSEQVQMPSGRLLATSSTVDVMVLYTKKALIDSTLDTPVDTIEQMETSIITAYEGANNAMEDSGLGLTLNVVHMAYIDMTESSQMSNDLYALLGGTGDAKDVPGMRNTYGADLVQMIGFYSGTCGMGFVMPSASASFAKYGYSIVHTNCISNFSHTHELGHNMGANHDRANVQQQNHAYAYAQRYCEGSTPFRTIMAYESGCSQAPRINLFSTPDEKYANRAQGSSTSDNARVISENMPYVANFRESTSPSPTPKSDTQPTAQPTTVSTYPNPIATKWMKRKGCFLDKWNDRVMEAFTKMPTVNGKTIGMTRDNCMAYCINKNKGYKHFGVKQSDKCYCWGGNNKYQRLGRLPNARCEDPCAGDSSTTCGGWNALEAFKIKTKVQSPNDEIAGFHGCYRHDWFDLEMANWPVLDYSNMKHDVCEAHCSSAGYGYFALEFGHACSCGMALPHDSLLADDESCSTSCTSRETTLNCGGNWHLAVFVVGDDNET